MVALLDGQYSYRNLVFGLGTDYPLTLPQIDGLEGFDARVGDTPLPRGHGDVPGKHFDSARQMLAEFVLIGTDRASLEARMAIMRAAFTVVEDQNYPLEFKKPGQDQRQVLARPTAFARGDTPMGLEAKPKVTLRAADPRIYSSDIQQVALPLYQPSGGALEYPEVEYPKEFAAGVSLDGVAHNSGAADAYPTLRWYGPAVGTLTGVTVANLTTGESLAITTPVTAGQILTFDGTAYVTGNGQLVVNLDGSSRYGAWVQPRIPLRLVPGDNVLRFTITGTATVVACIAEFRHTSLS